MHRMELSTAELDYIRAVVELSKRAGLERVRAMRLLGEMARHMIDFDVTHGVDDRLKVTTDYVSAFMQGVGGEVESIEMIAGEKLQ